MIYLARTDSGVIAVDLGWVGADRALRRGLRSLGATPDDVALVLLTHAHRDHIAAWRSVRHATFVVGAPEVERLVGRAQYTGVVPRVIDWLRPADRPRLGELRVRPFASDTIFEFGGDTVRAYLVPGHTPGSAAYLLRGVLFAGDAVSRTPLVGFGHAKRQYTDDYRQSRRSVASLWHRLAGSGVRWVCTAHGKCTRPDSALVHRLGP